MRDGESKVEDGRSILSSNERRNLLGRLRLHARHDVCVLRQRECGALVAESLADHLDRDASSERERGVGVAEVVESDASQAALLDEPVEELGEPVGQRALEKQTGQRHGRWKVSANSTNLNSPNLGGQKLRLLLEKRGWNYSAGWTGPPAAGRHLSECYPYTTLVGAGELRYDDERPVYKRKPNAMAMAEFRVHRADVCDGLISRMDSLAEADPPLRLRSHPVTSALLAEKSPIVDQAYKHREDLIDAAICAWTGLLWLQHGLTRCQVLGDDQQAAGATIIAPARTSQRG